MDEQVQRSVRPLHRWLPWWRGLGWSEEWVMRLREPILDQSSQPEPGRCNQQGLIITNRSRHRHPTTAYTCRTPTVHLTAYTCRTPLVLRPYWLLLAKPSVHRPYTLPTAP